MPLSLLLTTPGLCAYHDDAADILLLDLQGQLTLAGAQLAEAELLQLALHRPYARVIISTCYLSSLDLEAHRWLRQALAPGLQLLGVQKLAWVCQALPACLALAHVVLADLPVLATSFHDLEQAVSWLPNCPHALAGSAAWSSNASRTRHLTRALRRRVLAWSHPLLAYSPGNNRPLRNAFRGASLLPPAARYWAEARPGCVSALAS